MTQAAMYLRISLDHTGEGLAVDRQREACMEILKQRGWGLYKEYVDQSISASKRNVQRPAYNAMVSDYRAGKFNRIVCWDLDRLTRQPAQLEQWLEDAEDRGLQLVTANGEADLTTDNGRLFARLKAAVARSEIERKGERQKAAHAQRARRGLPGTGGIRPFGYNQDGSVNEDEAEVVRAIYNAVIQEWSLHDIARALNGEKTVAGKKLPKFTPTPPHMITVQHERNAQRIARGLEPKPVRDNYQWRYTTLHDILRNPRHAGYAYLNRKTNKRSARRELMRDESGEVIRGQWTPTVNPEVWETVQTILSDEKRRSNSGRVERVHMGSGLYICGKCGGTMQTHTQYYRCPRCKFGRSHKLIDNYVVQTVATALNKPHIIEQLQSDEHEEEIRSINEEIAERRGRIDRAQKDYDAEVIEGTDLKRIRDRERKCIDDLEAKRVALVAGDETAKLLSQPKPGDVFMQGNQMAKRQIVKALARVTLYPGVQGKKGLDPATVQIEWR